jgi:hypothetical protein
VTDGDVITAGPTAPVPFAREIIARLGVYEPKVLEAWYGLYSTGEAKYYFELVEAAGGAGRVSRRGAKPGTPGRGTR